MSQPLAILTAGSSLQEKWRLKDSQHYLEVFAINNACGLIPADWYCFVDRNMVSKMPELPPPKKGFMTIRARLDALPKAGERRRLTYHNLRTKHPIFGWIQNWYTFPSALMSITQQYPNNPIHIFGLDMDTGPDCKGNCFDHNSGRWRLELPWIAGALSKANYQVFGNVPDAFHKFVAAPSMPLLNLLAPEPKTWKQK